MNVTRLFRAKPDLILVQAPRAEVVGLQLPAGKAFSYLAANPRPGRVSA